MSDEKEKEEAAKVLTGALVPAAEGEDPEVQYVEVWHRRGGKRVLELRPEGEASFGRALPDSVYMIHFYLLKKVQVGPGQVAEQKIPVDWPVPAKSAADAFEIFQVHMDAYVGQVQMLEKRSAILQGTQADLKRLDHRQKSGCWNGKRRG